MIKWVIASVMVVCLVGAAGCVNVDVPEGPYVQVDESKNKTVSQSNKDFAKDFLKQAEEDGIITESQYQDLKKRLDACL